jgi:NADPH:quinone reductase-like Zn-dependent oxidoreductase
MWPTSFALKELTAADEARIGALVKKALPDPAAGSDEVLVDVELANITFVDTQIRAGRPPHPAMSARLPAVLATASAASSPRSARASMPRRSAGG